MHISNRTIIETASAAAAVYLIVDAYRCNIKLQSLVKRQKNALMYTVHKLDQSKVPMDEFDVIAFATIIKE